METNSSCASAATVCKSIDFAPRYRFQSTAHVAYFGAPLRNTKGLYLYGPVGCGKSMGMDLFFASLQGYTNLRIQRKHFHEFMYDVHRLLHRIKQEDDAGLATGLAVQRAGERIVDGLSQTY